MVDLTKLSADEQMKIKCGKAHFNEFDDLEYKVVNKVGQLMNKPTHLIAYLHFLPTDQRQGGKG